MSFCREGCLSPISPEAWPLVQSFICHNRTFILDGHVQLKTSLQTQERHLFLFTDLLVVAKSKWVWPSGTAPTECTFSSVEHTMDLVANLPWIIRKRFILTSPGTFENCIAIEKFQDAAFYGRISDILWYISCFLSSSPFWECSVIKYSLALSYVQCAAFSFLF